MFVTGAPLSDSGEGAPIEEISTIMKPNAAITIPIPIFFGVDGSIPFLFIQANAAITGKVRETINNGLNDWNISGYMEFWGPNGENNLLSKPVGSNPIVKNKAN